MYQHHSGTLDVGTLPGGVGTPNYYVARNVDFKPFNPVERYSLSGSRHCWSGRGHFVVLVLRNLFLRMLSNYYGTKQFL